MKQLVKTSLYALVLGASAFTGVAYAEETRAPCDGAKCKGDIPIELKVAKHCQVDVGNKISLKQDGTPSASWFRVTTNVPYTLNLSTANRGVQNDTFVLHADGTTKVATKITTKKGATNIPFGPTNHTGVSTDTYNVEARTAAAVASNQKYGIYKDTYQINVTY